MLSPDYFATVINGYLPEPHASLLNGIIFGIPLKNAKTFYDELKVVGITHLIVLSGMNITILSSFILGLTLHFGKYLSSLITILIIILFVIFVSPQAPIVRAALTGILTLVSSISGRRTLPLYMLFISALCIGLLWPEWITTVSFQLSYAATAGLIIFNKPSQNTSETSSLLNDLRLYIKDELKTTLAAQVFTVPIIFLYFKQISFIAPVTNIIVAWTVAPLMLFGFIAALLGSIHPVLGVIPAYLCFGILEFIILTVHLLAAIPYVFIKF